VLLRRAFLGASTAWLALIPLAAFAATRPSAASSIYGLAAGVYAVGQFVCHQLPARSFHLWGAQLPVCARCTGIYAGAAAGALVLCDSRLRRRATRLGDRARILLLAAAVPTAVTLVFEWTTGVTPANWIRALAGLPLGAAVAWAIGMVN
jgi:uncharacterized membrane protein